MEEIKLITLEFNKWLFENNYVPNRSFLWFDYTASTPYFFRLEELFDCFHFKKSPSQVIQEKNSRYESLMAELNR